MPRIASVDPNSAAAPVKDLFAIAQQALGATPNFVRAMATAPAALQGFLQLFGALSGGKLDNATRERIALAMAEKNACEYCVSAHTALARGAGLDAADIAAARQGGSTNPKANAAVQFARAVLEAKGDVSASDFAAVKAAGYGDEEIVEIVLHVGMNTLLNTFGRFSQIDIDFPRVALLGRGA